jgi:cytochrome c
MRPIVLAVVTMVAVTPVAAQQQAAATDGAQVFTMVCAMCHSVQPPAKAAPPMSHVTGNYLRKHLDTTAAAAAIVAYLKKPEAARSLMPPMAIERFGLMPAQSHLSDAQLDAVARYVLTLADTTHGHGRMRH